jgi:hypothetical protein
MKSRIKLAVLSAVVVIAGLASRTQAADFVDMDIHVSINAAKDVTVDTTFYYFGAVDINASSNSVTPIQVTNNSSALIQTYTIKGGTATSDTAGTDWNLVAASNTVGSNTYALAAQFTGTGSQRPDNVEATWDSDYMRVDEYITCTTTVFGDGTAGDEGANVAPSADRYLYFRINTPTSTTDGGAHTATIRLSVL